MPLDIDAKSVNTRERERSKGYKEKGESYASKSRLPGLALGFICKIVQYEFSIPVSNMGS